MALGRILLLEDDSFVRSTLATLLREKGFDVVGSVSTAEEAVEIASLRHPEVLLADIDLGVGPTGVDIARGLRKSNPKLGVVFLTSFSDPRFIGIAEKDLPAGAMYFTKSRVSDVSSLLTAILQVKAQPLATHRKLRFESTGLTDNQVEILRLVSEGMTTTAISERQGVSVKSVEATLSRLHATLNLPREPGLNPRIQLTRAFIQLSGKDPGR